MKPGLAFFLAIAAFAQGYLTPLESNKKVVFDFYRLVVETRNTDLTPQFVAESFVEHSPGKQSGREGLVKTIQALPGKPAEELGPALQNPPALIVAEGDVVTYIFKRGDTFTFDAFRVKDRKIIEHWDGEKR